MRSQLPRYDGRMDETGTTAVGTSEPGNESRPALNWSINGRFTTQQITGVQRYAREIVSALDDILSQNPDVARRIGLRLILPGTGVTGAPDLHAIRLVSTSVLSGHLWDQLVLPFHEKDGILSLGNFGPIFARRHIVCIHDANTFIEPDSYSLKFRMAYQTLLPWIGRRAARVATVSEFSANMLATYGVCARNKIFIAPNGHEHVLRWDSRLAKLPFLAGVKRPYVLLLGSRAKHKNIQVVLQNAAALDQQGLDIVVVGSASGIFSDQASAGTAPNVHYTGYLGDNELAALYAGALCLAFPSRTEGFGIPLLEAMTTGCPVVSSDAASLKEVGGDAVLYAAPDRPQDWLLRIASLAGNQALRTSLIERGRKQAALFSWNRSAGIYLDEILRLAE